MGGGEAGEDAWGGTRDPMSRDVSDVTAVTASATAVTPCWSRLLSLKRCGFATDGMQ